MLELRILNGYHRGATLPLHGEALTVGAGEDADVVLVDPGMQERHASVTPGASGWSLRALDGVVRDADSNRPHDELQLPVGGFARVDHIWLTVVDQDSPWQDPPAEPLDDGVVEPLADTDSIYADADSDAQDDEGSGKDDKDETETPPIEQQENARVFPGRRSRKHRLILAPVAVVAVLSAAAAYSMTRSYTPLNDSASFSPGEVELNPATMEPIKLPGNGAIRMGSLSSMGSPDDMAAARKGKGAASNSSARPATLAAAAPTPLSPIQLQEAFRRRLTEVDLIKRFNLQLDEQSWTMQAALDEEDAERFQRMLNAFMKRYDIRFPVNVKIGNAESMLPFRIQQVISGNNASIVTDDGRRMYVGDEYRGAKLAAIDGNQLSFTGKRSIDIKW